MTWEELKAKHSAEWKEFHKGYEQSWEKLQREKAEVLEAFNYMTSKIPRSVQNILENAHKEWQAQWGIDGRQGKALKTAQEKETKAFYERERIKRELGIATEKRKDRGLER